MAGVLCRILLPGIDEWELDLDVDLDEGGGPGDGGPGGSGGPSGEALSLPFRPRETLRFC